MIKSILLGKISDIEKYSPLFSRSKFFRIDNQLIIPDDLKVPFNLENVENFDALFLLSPVSDPFTLFSYCLKNVKNLFFVDQPFLKGEVVDQLNSLYNESGGLMFPEFTTINHPLIEEFVKIESGQLHYKYIKSINGKKDYRAAFHEALALLSVISPMPVKKIDVSTFDTTLSGHPSFKVRLKLYDSSDCNILLDIDNKKDHIVEIESPKGNFIFNFANNYLENSLGSKFQSEVINDEELREKTINAFAMDIIFKKRPVYSLFHYLLVIRLLDKIETILRNSL